MAPRFGGMGNESGIVSSLHLPLILYGISVGITVLDGEALYVHFPCCHLYCSHIVVLRKSLLIFRLSGLTMALFTCVLRYCFYLYI